MKKLFLLSMVIAVIIVTFSTSQAALLGPASEYNVFLFGDMNVATSDSQGRIAVGGNINMSNYSIGILADPADYSIVGGGNIDFGPGSVNNGGIFATGDITLHNYYINGDVTANGAINYTAGGTITGSATQNAGAVSPVDFASAYSSLSATSLALAAIDATGTTTVTPWNAITLTGTEDVNYFDLDGTDLGNAVSLTFNIGSDAQAIVNVSGIYDEFSGFGIFGATGKEDNIIYNFFEADDILIHSIGIRGTILAPDANIEFNSGVMQGSLIANSFSGTGQTNQSLPGHDDIPVNPVPEPSTMLLLGGGMVGIIVCRKKFK